MEKLDIYTLLSPKNLNYIRTPQFKVSQLDPDTRNGKDPIRVTKDPNDNSNMTITIDFILSVNTSNPNRYALAVQQMDLEVST